MVDVGSRPCSFFVLHLALIRKLVDLWLLGVARGCDALVLSELLPNFVLRQGVLGFIYDVLLAQ
jgi:hypothetical protein